MLILGISSWSCFGHFKWNSEDKKVLDLQDQRSPPPKLKTPDYVTPHILLTESSVYSVAEIFRDFFNQSDKTVKMIVPCFFTTANLLINY